MLDSTQATSAPRPLPKRGPARLTERSPIRKGLTVNLDGTRVVLMDLSPVGAQVLSSTCLRPGQHVRLSVADEETALQLVATVVAVWYEGPSARGTPEYRASLYLINADREGIAAFGARNRRVDSVKPTAPPMAPPRVAVDFKVKGYNIYGNETNCKNRRAQPWVVIFKRDHASPVIPNLIKFKH